ncbi:hypothetical protein AVEN_82306-1 [Araneus ventricosus]|uniref:Uncharacterized protein n=1 Tax=Araneus ventricosus TaxID=182803 RepID=A0A4Y2N8H0_ARAVE|nr:hypothetical protein AVEN_82306-1 [Araneus ventricosus]
MIDEDLQKFSESRVTRTIAIGRVPIRNLPKRQFQCRPFRVFLPRLFRVKVIHIAPYHSQSKGLLEILRCQLKSLIQAHADERWNMILPSILLGERASVKEPLNCSVAKMVYATPIAYTREIFSTNKILSINDFLASLQL